MGILWVWQIDLTNLFIIYLILLILSVSQATQQHFTPTLSNSIQNNIATWSWHGWHSQLVFIPLWAVLVLSFEWQIDLHFLSFRPWHLLLIVFTSPGWNYGGTFNDSKAGKSARFNRARVKYKFKMMILNGWKMCRMKMKQKRRCWDPWNIKLFHFSKCQI